MRKPYKLTKLKRNAYIKLLRNGRGRYQAAAGIGVSHNTVNDYKKKDKEFTDACDLAELDAVGEVECLLMDNCRNMKEASIFFLLCNRSKDRWQHRQTIEQKVEIKEQVEYEVTWGNRLLKEPKNGKSKSELTSILTQRSKPLNGASQDSKS